MSMFSKRPPRTLFEYLIAEGGVIGGSRVATFIIAVAMARALMEPTPGERGGELGMEQFAEISGYSLSKAYRDLRLYRKLVPQFPNVLDLVDELETMRKAQRQHSVSSVNVGGLFA